MTGIAKHHAVAGGPLGSALQYPPKIPKSARPGSRHGRLAGAADHIRKAIPAFVETAK
jgi:hypothetical protein